VRNWRCYTHTEILNNHVIISHFSLTSFKQNFKNWHAISRWRSVGRRTCDREVVGNSIPGRISLHNNLGQVVHTSVPLSLSSIDKRTDKRQVKQNLIGGGINAEKRIEVACNKPVSAEISKQATRSAPKLQLLLQLAPYTHRWFARCSY